MTEKREENSRLIATHEHKVSARDKVGTEKGQRIELRRARN